MQNLVKPTSKIDSDKKRGVKISVLVRQKMQEIFTDHSEVTVIRSPGRINLIGEHTDYNNGFVMPGAINRYIYIAIALRRDFKANVLSLDFDEAVTFDTRRPERHKNSWANYIIGVVNAFKESGQELPGFDAVFSGDIPIGAGLSSSAALETGFAFAIDSLLGLGLSKIELSRLSQKAENDFVGVRCGIMDQFANLFGKEGHAIFLDTMNLNHEYVPFRPPDMSLLLCDSGVKHELASSEYNLRRQYTESGVSFLRNHFPGVNTLRDVNRDMLKILLNHGDRVIYEACDYVLEENERVKLSYDLLLRSDYLDWGKLLYESHKGLKEKYRVSCDELDFLVDTASRIEGVVGARMMGGGFGGCTLNLVYNHIVKEFKETIADKYSKHTGRSPVFYDVKLSNGTEIVNN
ncbi:MAG: galactokinase [Candidatus Kryptoniota bacterium]